MPRMPFPACVPELTDGVVRLRAHRPTDTGPIAEQSADPLSQAWTAVPRHYHLSDAQFFLDLIEKSWNDSGGGRYWAVEWVGDAREPRYGGTIDLRPMPATGTVTVGYGLHPAARGRAVMSRALRLACRWWFDQGGKRVHWSANRGNFTSWRVAWACGFVQHGQLPEYLAMPGGRAVDVWVGSLGRDDDMAPRQPWHEPPILEAAGVRLRPWRDEDLEAVEPSDHPAHHVPDGAFPTSETAAEWLLTRRERMSRGESVHWCIADAETDRALGDAVVILTGQFEGAAEVGYVVFPSARGRGVATAAARLASEWALRPEATGGLGRRRLTAFTAADNEASNRILDRAGFAVWGREAAVDVLADGGLVDGLHWQRLC